VEVIREYDVETLQRGHDVRWNDGQPSLTVWERTTRRLMSDGKILEKRDVRFRPNPLCTWEDPRGEKHSYGWKIHGTLKAGLTAADFTRIYQAPRKRDGSPSPWTVTSGHVAAPVIISQRRIVAAIQSGESIGFCTECGAERDGCEPDARNYPCESCGQHAVMGAEELLIGMA